MAVKERFQNPIVGDQLKLRLFAYNSNNYRNFFSVVKVDIYALDDTKTSANPLGKRFVKLKIILKYLQIFGLRMLFQLFMGLILHLDQTK